MGSARIMKQVAHQMVGCMLDCCNGICSTHLDVTSLSGESKGAEGDADSNHAFSLHCARAWMDAKGAARWLSDRPFAWLGSHERKRTSARSINIDGHPAEVELVWKVNSRNAFLAHFVLL